MITFCLTSCGRPDLLKRTLESFFQYNTAPISRYIVCEDLGKPLGIERLFPQVEFYYNEKRLGMMRNIQKAYSFVTTPYIFHCEDDWQFYKYGFIEKSLSILESDEKILTVWLRKQIDINGHPVEKTIHHIDGVNYQYVETNYLDVWHGYTTNPGLRRLKDVANFSEIIKGSPGSGEDFISEYYFKKGFRSVILTEGFVKHIGDGRTSMNFMYEK